jgi:para-aminobenzoate synthetase/4-amino-4-deoxychorismate lyase
VLGVDVLSTSLECRATVAGYPLDMSHATRPRLVRRPLGWSLTSADVLRLVRADAHPVALCGAWAGGGDVIAADPVAVRAAPGPLAEVLDDDFAGPVDFHEPGQVGSDRSFGGGWIGYLGYSAGGEALPPTGPRALPAWWFGYYDHVLHRDRATEKWYFEALWTPERADALEARFEELDDRAALVLAGGTPDLATGPNGYEFGAFRLIPGAAGHQEAVRKAVEYIRQGDIFQANITLRAEADFAGDPLDAFCQGVTALDPPYAAFIRVSAPGARHAAVASLSPELFLRRTGRDVTSKPIKGTARRASDDTEAEAQRAELEASVKNRAENVMIVDLVRNDLSRVCVPGSVTVPVLLGTESHPGVWHLVSTVTGTLTPGVHDGDLIRAAFPPGSVTGAPKVRALEIIDELETTPRETYTGAVGYRSPVAGLELNVAIRTFEFAAGPVPAGPETTGLGAGAGAGAGWGEAGGGWGAAGGELGAAGGESSKAWIGAGGGIVADSDPAGEYAESLIKATPLLTALGAALDTDSAVGADAEADRGADGDPDADAVPSAGAGAGALDVDAGSVGAGAAVPAGYNGAAGIAAMDWAALLPRPSAGVFTSLLVTNGATNGLAAHLARLEASVRDLYGKALPASLTVDLARCLGARPSGRLRITVRPIGGPLQARVEVVPVLPPPISQAGSQQATVSRSAASQSSASQSTVPQSAVPQSSGSTTVTLLPVTVPGGISAHKFRDRRLLAELAASKKAGRDRHLLLTDETGEILETDRANVFAVMDGVLLTPPADGRLLPGTTRAAVLRAARDYGIRIGQKPLTLDELAQATEIFVTNAVAGLIPVAAVETVPRTWHPGPVTAALAAVLAARPADPPSAPVAAPRLARPYVGARAPRVAPSAAPPLMILIDNYDSFTWNLAHLLYTAGARVEVVRNDEVTASEVIEAGPAGVVLSPGPCAPAEAGISIAAVTACAQARVPLLGICLGHQAIGAAFGAKIIKAPSPVHGKAFPVTHHGYGVLRGLPSPFDATRYHSLIVDETTLPRDLLVTARTDGITMAVSHRTRPIEGVQFHPESILTAYGARIIASFVSAAAHAQTGER